jgi:TatD DNase family protein
MIIHGFSKKEQLAKQLLIMGFIFGKYLLRNPELESVLRVFQTIDFLGNGYRRRNNCEVYTLAAKYKNITVTEIQKK